MTASGHQRPRRAKPYAHARPLCPESGQVIASQRNDAMCHKRPNAAQQNPCLFDHLVGDGEQRGRHLYSDRASSCEVDDELKPNRTELPASRKASLP
jgi:hypothetical protein